MQHLKITEKKHYNQIKNLIKQIFKKKDLILLHDSKFKMSHSVKLKFCWSDLYWVHKIIEKKDTYFLEKLNETSFRKNFHRNWLKKFWIRDENFYALMSSEKETTSIQQTQSATEVQDLNNNNNTSYISSEQNFTILIK